MRRVLPVLATLAVGAAAAPVAVAITPVSARVSVRPATVALGQPVTIRGHGWVVNEFCDRTVRLSLRSAQNAAPIGPVRVTDRGTLRLRWTPSSQRVGPGRWKVVARQRCESGDDGKANWIVSSTRIRLTD